MINGYIIIDNLRGLCYFLCDFTVNYLQIILSQLLDYCDRKSKARAHMHSLLMDCYATRNQQRLSL